MKLYTCYSPSHKVLYENFFLKTVPKEEFDIISYEIPQECPSASFYQCGWEQTCFQKVKIFLKICKENIGNTFVFSDVDVQFFGNIKDVLLDELGEFDIACQNDTGNTYCSGFFICRANQNTLKMFESMVEKYDTEDQKTLNQNIHLVKSKFLSNKFFTIGNLIHNSWKPSLFFPLIPTSILMHHANFTIGIENKIKLLNAVREQLGYETISTRNN